MNSIQSKKQIAAQSNQVLSQENQLLLVQPQNTEIAPSTFGQKVADAMAEKVGSWAFLIGQTTVLAGWVGLNMSPGMPHWDESPFMMLNLVFSFASAYTAPIVLMSQNRQSDEDRKHSKLNHRVNLQTAQNLELLHDKFDQMYSQKLDELSSLIQQQKENNVLLSTENDEKVNVIPTIHFPIASENLFLQQYPQSVSMNNTFLNIKFSDLNSNQKSE